MSIEKYKNKIEEEYKKYFKKLGIDKKTGELKDNSRQDIWNRRFATYPYIGSKYGKKKKILFIGLDVGFDSGRDKITDLDDRRDDVEENFDEEKIFKKNEDRTNRVRNFPNPHMLGTYLCVMHELNKDSWDKVNDKTKKDLKKDKYKDLLTEDNYIQYSALTNVYKYVSIGRKKLRGSQDRVFLSFPDDLILLRKEIEALSPKIIFLQGADFRNDKNFKNFFKKIRKGVKKIRKDGKCKIYTGNHPSWPRAQKSKMLFETIELLEDE